MPSLLARRTRALIVWLLLLAALVFLLIGTVEAFFVSGRAGGWLSLGVAAIAAAMLAERSRTIQ